MDLETAHQIAKITDTGAYLREILLAAAGHADLAAWVLENLHDGRWVGGSWEPSTQSQIGGKWESSKRAALGREVSNAITNVRHDARRVIADEKDTRIDLALRRLGEVISVEIPGVRVKWVKTVSGISYDKGVYTYGGENLKPGRFVDLPIGTLFLCYHDQKYATLHIVVPTPEGNGQELVAYSSLRDWSDALRPEIRNWLVKTGKRV